MDSGSAVEAATLFEAGKQLFPGFVLRCCMEDVLLPWMQQEPTVVPFLIHMSDTHLIIHFVTLYLMPCYF